MILDKDWNFVANDTSRSINLSDNLLLSATSKYCLHRSLLREIPCNFTCLC